MEKVSATWLSAIETLKDVPHHQLQWLLDQSALLELKEGDILFKPGDKIKGTYILIEGKFRLCVAQGNEMREVAVFESQAITGHLPFSRGKAASAIAEAVTNVVYLLFPIESSEEMIRTHFELTQALVHIMTTRVRDFTALQQQNEKMMALGKLSAGLAHELNNPAAAVVRGATSLIQHLKFAPDTFKKLLSIKLDTDGIDYISGKLFAVLSKAEKPSLTMMQRSSLEDDVLDWLDDHNVANGQEVAENLVDFGFSLKNLDDIAQQLSENTISEVFGWINNNLTTEKMVIDIQEASRRIADLVGSVKTFTHMDQGSGKQYADIHTGISNTLTMLQHKVRHGNVQVIEQFDTTLPHVNAMIGELNQVWTNLIDNALDAMEVNGKGILNITTARINDCVKVSIVDNGPGIPQEIKTMIFDPFFTTKEIGKGTGLGLDVVFRIVKQHQGSIKVNSEPGQTAFIVEFPING